MWGNLQFRQMELHMILFLRRLNITKGKIRYDGQFVWLER